MHKTTNRMYIIDLIQNYIVMLYNFKYYVQEDDLEYMFYGLHKDFLKNISS